MTRARDLASGLAGVRPFATAAGSAVPTGGGQYVSITFPSGRFTQAPQVVGTVDGAGATAAYAMTANITTSGATLQSLSVSGYTIRWIAIQMTSGSASG